MRLEGSACGGERVWRGARVEGSACGGERLEGTLVSRLRQSCIVTICIIQYYISNRLREYNSFIGRDTAAVENPKDLHRYQST